MIPELIIIYVSNTRNQEPNKEVILIEREKQKIIRETNQKSEIQYNQNQNKLPRHTNKDKRNTKNTHGNINLSK